MSLLGSTTGASLTGYSSAVISTLNVSGSSSVGGSLTTGGNINAAGNVTGSCFVGNGSNLSGLSFAQLGGAANASQVPLAAIQPSLTFANLLGVANTSQLGNISTGGSSGGVANLFSSGNLAAAYGYNSNYYSANLITSQYFPSSFVFPNVYTVFANGNVTFLANSSTYAPAGWMRGNVTVTASSIMKDWQFNPPLCAASALGPSGYISTATFSGQPWVSAYGLYNQVSGNYTGQVCTTTVTGNVYGEWVQVSLPTSLIVNSAAFSPAYTDAATSIQLTLCGYNSSIGWSNLGSFSIANSATGLQKFAVSNANVLSSALRLVVNNNGAAIEQSGNTFLCDVGGDVYANGADSGWAYVGGFAYTGTPGVVIDGAGGISRFAAPQLGTVGTTITQGLQFSRFNTPSIALTANVAYTANVVYPEPYTCPPVGFVSLRNNANVRAYVMNALADRMTYGIISPANVASSIYTIDWMTIA